MLNEECAAIHWQPHHGLPPGFERLAERRYVVDGQSYSYEKMLEANEHDDDFCAWLRVADVGDVFANGAGCRRTR